MHRFDSIAALLSETRPGYTLPRNLYVSEEAYRFDVEVMLKSVWLYACTVAHVKNPGDWYLFELGETSVIIVRGKDGDVRAFHNTCAHRGAKICQTAKGRSPRLMCPYHQWTYALDGRLVAARNMSEDFDKSQHGLVAVALENVGGLIFLCLSDNPPPIGRAKADIADQLSLYHLLDRLKVAVQDDLIEHANWKLVMENNRECYHCDAHHPELLKSLSTYGFGKGLPEDGSADVVDDVRCDAMLDARRHWQDIGIYRDLIEFPDNGWHRLARLPLAHGAVSQTLDGRPASAIPIWPHGLDESSSLSVWTQPNSWHHFCCDHVVTFSVTPLGPDRTLLRTSWLVHEDAVEGVDYDPEKLTAVWRATNKQDSYLASINHTGIRCDGYRPGPYSVEEKLVEAFKTFYVEVSQAALADG